MSANLPPSERSWRALRQRTEAGRSLDAHRTQDDLVERLVRFHAARLAYRDADFADRATWNTAVQEHDSADAALSFVAPHLRDLVLEALSVMRYGKSPAPAQLEFGTEGYPPLLEEPDDA
ncbi:hypothetical protein [Corallococcus sp. M7]